MNVEVDRVTARRERLRKMLMDRITAYSEFIRKLENDDLFDRRLFYSFRIGTGTQADWAAMTGVSQGTIGNWERGVTYPARHHRLMVSSAAKGVLLQEQDRIDAISQSLGIKVKVDVVGTQNQLNSSILRAALTDFQFDAASGNIVAVPFESDGGASSVDQIVRDKRNLLEALSEQCLMIVDGLSRGANTETDRFVEYLSKYGSECRKSEPNPRLLHRFGSTISGRTGDDGFRGAINGWDDQAIDGFNADHVELMRLYFREALARAQEVEASTISDDDSDVDAADSFYRVADLISSATGEAGKPIFSEDIPTLLRDIGREVRDFGEAEAFTYDDRRRAVLRRRRREAIKSGSIYIGRILFFTSLFVVMSPEALGAASNVAGLLGLMDQIAPGTIRSIYDRIRTIFPILPKLEVKEKKKSGNA